MSTSRPTLHELVAAHQEGPDEALSWTGGFADYLALLDADPRPARNAWQRLADMVESHGVERLPSGRARWRIFDDPFHGGEDAVLGLEEPLCELVRVLRAGARGLGPERRVILLHGPVGSAKSSIARLLKRGLEQYSRCAAGALYTFDWLVDGTIVPSPMNQDPLLLLSDEARRVVEQRLTRALKGECRIRIEGELDPVSRHWQRELLARHGGDWRRVLEHVRVRRFALSEKDRVGIGTFQPKDEKNQDSTELTGDINFRRIAEFGSDSDPRAFNFDGEFNVANRGLLEFVEVLKLDVAFLYDLLGATQEHVVKPRKFAQVSIDEVIIGHTNEPEYKKLVANDLMEAFRDRTIKIDVPYNLSVRDEAAIHRRRFVERGVPGRVLAPHAIEMAALWAVMTRLEDPSHSSLTLAQKARLYDGGALAGWTAEAVAELRESHPREGLSGIGPRYVQDRIAAALSGDDPVVGAEEVLDEIVRGLRHNSLVSNEEVRKRCLRLVALARSEHEETIKREVQAAVASDPAEVEALCAKYVDNAKAWATREKLVDARGRECEPDERLMRAIEEKMEIPEARKADFRHELLAFVSAVQSEGGVFEWRDNARLVRALEAKVFEDRRDCIQLTSLVSTVVDPDAMHKIAVIRDRLVRDFHYDQRSAERVLRRVAGLHARGDDKPLGEAA